MATSTTGYELYDGKVKLLYQTKGRSHWYEVGGKRAPGVTTVVGILDKPSLIYWAVNCAVEYLDANLKPGKVIDEVRKQELLEEAKRAHRQVSGRALTIGAEVHNWIEKHVRRQIEDGKRGKKDMPVNPEIVNSVKSFLEWEEQHDVEYIDTERKLYSREYGYAGTLDIEAKVDGKFGVLDIKTSKGIYVEYKLQLAAYRQAREEESGRSFPECHIIRVPKDGGAVEVEKLIDFDAALDGFIGCLVAYRALDKLKHLEKARQAAADANSWGLAESPLRSTG